MTSTVEMKDERFFGEVLGREKPLLVDVPCNR